MISDMELRKRLKKAYKRLKNKGGWRAVGREFGIPARTAWRISERDYVPKNAHLRTKLGLTTLAPAPVCPKCGKVHVTKRCTSVPASRTRRSLWDWPVDELRRALENREEMK